MTAGCRKCLTTKSAITTAEDEVRRIARQMSRASDARLSVLKDHLAIAKANLTMARNDSAGGHECDTRLSDEHWTKVRA